MRLNRDDAVAMFVALGFKTAKSWNKRRMKKKLVEIAQDMAKDDFWLAIEEGEDAERLDQILQAVLAAGGEVEVSPSEETKLREREDEEAAEMPPEKAPDFVDTDPVDPDQVPATAADMDDFVDAGPQAAAPPKKRGRPKGKKNKAEGKEGTISKPSRPKVLGAYSAGAFVRWLGKQGVGFDGAKALLEAEGVTHLKDISIRQELRETRGDNLPAGVTGKHEKSLRKAHPDVFVKAA